MLLGILHNIECLVDVAEMKAVIMEATRAVTNDSRDLTPEEGLFERSLTCSFLAERLTRYRHLIQMFSSLLGLYRGLRLDCRDVKEAEFRTEAKVLPCYENNKRTHHSVSESFLLVSYFQ